MDGYLSKSRGFIGSSQEYESAHFVLFGIPMDFTASFQPGSRWGPRAIREASDSLEEYSFYCRRSLEEIKYYDGGDLILPFGNVEESLRRIEKVTETLLADGKFPLALGGEHLVTLALVRAFMRKYPKLAVFQLDAHADLRDSYCGETLSHATVMRRVAEAVGPENVYQFGIRSGTAEEYAFGRKHTRMFVEEISQPLKKIVKEWDGRPVYLTLDIDVIDPAYAPGTGTPEPGGCSSKEILQVIGMLSHLPVVGMDLVEVVPHLDSSQRTAILAAKLVREALLAFSSKE